MSNQTAAALLRSKILPIVPICDPAVYAGDAGTYTVYNITETPECFGDNMPTVMRYICALHYYLPSGVNARTVKRQLRAAIAEIGTYPTITDASDLDGQHYVFEFEMADGDV